MQKGGVSMESTTYRRVRDELKSGAIFFTDCYERGVRELRLNNGRLVYLRRIGGGDGDPETEVFVPRRLGKVIVGRRHIIVLGEMWYRLSGRDCYDLDEGLAQLKYQMLVFKRQLNDEDALLRHLDELMTESKKIEPTPFWRVFKDMTARTLPAIIFLIAVTAMFLIFYKKG
jgi:hypothetical protein